MDNREVFDLVQEALETKDWISPGWQPWVKCSDEEKSKFTIFRNLIGKFAPRSLGAIAISFEKCDPNRQFIFYEKDMGHDPNFLSKYFKDEYKEYE